MASTRRRASAKVHWPVRKSLSPGARSIWNRLWMMGRRKSKSPSRTELSARWDCARARFTAVNVLPSAGEGLVTTMVCSGCSDCRWLSRVRSVRNSSAGVSCELPRSSRCDSGAGEKGTTRTSLSIPGWMLSRSGPTEAAEAPPFIPASGGRRSGLTWPMSSGTSGGSSGIIPPISARLNASCTLLMDSPLRGAFGDSGHNLCAVAKVVVVGRSAHGDGAENSRAGPGQPQKAPFPAHQQRVFQQRDAAQNGQIGVGADILQILQRGILHLLGASQHDAENQAKSGAHGSNLGAVGFGGRLRVAGGIQHFQVLTDRKSVV